ncbi:DedA family protein, partial [Methylobacterium organophilum]|nr:DedA family protein [Methylobacterium organophilum]
MLRRLYAWILALSDRPSAPYALGAVAFAESSFFPVPPDVMLVPMAVARPDRVWLYATITTVASVLGGLVGY